MGAAAAEPQPEPAAKAPPPGWRAHMPAVLSVVDQGLMAAVQATLLLCKLEVPPACLLLLLLQVPAASCAVGRRRGTYRCYCTALSSQLRGRLGPGRSLGRPDSKAASQRMCGEGL